MLEATRLAKFEQSMFEHFNRVVWVTEEDRKAFPEPSMQDKTEHHVIPIAVDTATRVPMTRTNPFRVTFLGGVHWPPNAEGVRWFLKDVWPAVLRAVPNTVFTVIGKGSFGRHGHQEPGVEVTGYVPDPTELLEETVVFVVPLLTGAGMRVKILDAWSWALPVVSTTIGAEGIRSLHGENILISDDPAEFTDSLVRVLRSSELASRLSAGGRATVESHYDWRAVYQAWDRVYG
jgi:glycosyltransferase involved in cell wall biosynthesis